MPGYALARSGAVAVMAALAGCSGQGSTEGEKPAGGGWTPSFRTQALASDYVAEGAAIGDIDGDDNADFWAGPRWYAGPGLELGGHVYEVEVFPIEGAAKRFASFLDDLDGDGDLDGVAFGFPGRDVSWYENPGPDALSQPWAVHVMVASGVGSEAPLYADLVGDARAELVFLSRGVLGYAEPGPEPTSAWTFKAVSGDLGWPASTHGLGVGDIDGDGLNDIVDRAGVWLQRAEAGADPTWQRHAHDFAPGGRGGAQMLIFDVDGDEDSDVVTSIDAHQYGLAWFEQTLDQGALSFARHEILPSRPADGNFSQPHALAAADINGDGLLDFVTGKRYYAHPPPQDPGALDPAVIYWFELSRNQSGVAFTPHLIHDDSGVGTDVACGDLNTDGKPDIAVVSKKGTFVHSQD